MELRRQGARLLVVRWWFAALLVAGGVFSAQVEAGTDASAFFSVAIVVSLLNAGYSFFRHHFGHGGREPQNSLVVELILDALCFAGLAASTGGLQSPFVCMLLIPFFNAIHLLGRLLPWLSVGVLLLPAAILAVLESLFTGTDKLPSPGWVLVSWGAVGACFLWLTYCGRPLVLVDAEGRWTRQSRLDDPNLHSSAEEKRLCGLLTTFVCHFARSIQGPMGIVRARAEALRLQLGEPGNEAPHHDLDVLLKNLDTAHKNLRGFFSFLPLARGRQGRIDVCDLISSELKRFESSGRSFVWAGKKSGATVDGSREDLELAVGLLFQIAEELGMPRSRTRIRTRLLPDRFVLDLRFPLTEPWRLSRDELADDAASVWPSWWVRLAVIQRILEKHGGELFWQRRVDTFCSRASLSTLTQTAMTVLKSGDHAA